MVLTPGQERFWQAYLDGLAPGSRPDGPVVVSCPGTPELADRLIDLYLTGQKVAGSGLIEDYLTCGDPLPQVGDHWIALASDGRPRCILRTISVETHRFKDVPERIAIAEGEGDRSLECWQRSHAEAFGSQLAEWGVADLDEATVVTEFFTLVYP